MRLTLILILLVKLGYSQTFQCLIKDSSTMVPIAFVNIGITGKTNGTVSDETGHFIINLPDGNDLDSMRFSCIGYATKFLLVKEFKKNSASTNTCDVKLSPQAIMLSEVVVKNKDSKPNAIGNKPASRLTSIGMLDNRLGAEIGSFFKVDNAPLFIDSIRIYIAKCNPDSIFLRLNVYKVLGKQFVNILKSPVYLRLSREEALKNPVIDLAEQSLSVDGDFFVSVEHIKGLGTQKLWFYARMHSDKYPAMFRETSQDIWKYSNKPSAGVCFLAFTH